MASDAASIFDHQVHRRFLGGFAAHSRDLAQRFSGQRLERVITKSDKDDLSGVPTAVKKFSHLSVGVRISAATRARIAGSLSRLAHSL